MFVIYDRSREALAIGKPKTHFILSFRILLPGMSQWLFYYCFRRFLRNHLVIIRLFEDKKHFGEVVGHLCVLLWYFCVFQPMT